MKKAYLGVDIGSISTKAVIIDSDNNILLDKYIWTEGNPIKAVNEILSSFKKNVDKDIKIVCVGTTGSARKLIGSILNAIKKGKKIIAAARLAEYKEHHNDHQKQIIKEFEEQGYLLELKDFNELGKLIVKAKKFKPKKFVSNTKNMVKLIEDYIEESNNTSWFNKGYEVLSYLFFGGLTTLVNILTFWLLRVLKMEVYTSNVIAWVVSVLFAFITNKLFVFESKGNTLKQCISFFGFRLLSLVFDMGIMYLFINILNMNDLLSKVITNVFIVIINYVFSKIFVFKK